MIEELKVMIVDDEELERNLISVCINWNQMGMRIVSSMSSAREALDYIDDINPDIIITDIRMPFMDGLEFSKIIAETYPYIKVIILTAHEEFEYAKVGIKVGISDFLLKPIKRSELRTTLENIKKKIFMEREQISQHEELKRQVEKNFPYLKEKFLNELILNNITLEEVKEKMDYYSICYNSDFVQIALIETDYANYDRKETKEENKVFMTLKSIDLVKSYFRDDNLIEIFTDNSQRIVVFNNNKDINLEICIEHIKVMIINRLKCFVSIGIGNKYNKFGFIKKSYDEALEALNYKVVIGRNNIVCFREININKAEVSIKLDEISEIGFNVKIGSVEKLNRLIDNIFNDFYNPKYSNIDYIRVTSINIITMVLNSVMELGINYNDVINEENLPYEKILKLETLPEIKNFLVDFVDNIINNVKNIRTRKTNKVVSEIVKYINKNLNNSKLSLSFVSKIFYLNLSYLSRIFKNETGCTFIEYLTRARIEKSTGLFKTTDLMVYEVAEKVGIPDPKYFGKCFKKHIGMSVNDFKKQL
ncbi:MAG: response regulator [Clostridiales bacterium]